MKRRVMRVDQKLIDMKSDQNTLSCLNQGLQYALKTIGPAGMRRTLNSISIEIKSEESIFGSIGYDTLSRFSKKYHEKPFKKKTIQRLAEFLSQIGCIDLSIIGNSYDGVFDRIANEYSNLLSVSKSHNSQFKFEGVYRLYLLDESVDRYLIAIEFHIKPFKINHSTPIIIHSNQTYYLIENDEEYKIVKELISSYNYSEIFEYTNIMYSIIERNTNHVGFGYLLGEKYTAIFSDSSVKTLDTLSVSSIILHSGCVLCFEFSSEDMKISDVSNFSQYKGSISHWQSKKSIFPPQNQPIFCVDCNISTKIVEKIIDIYYSDLRSLGDIQFGFDAMEENSKFLEFARRAGAQERRKVMAALASCSTPNERLTIAIRMFAPRDGLLAISDGADINSISPPSEVPLLHEAAAFGMWPFLKKAEKVGHPKFGERDMYGRLPSDHAVTGLQDPEFYAWLLERERQAMAHQAEYENPSPKPK